MTSEQIENLKRIARAATIGEWHSNPGHSGSRGRKYRGASLWAGDDESAGYIAISHVFYPGHDANWAHIAAASPKTVLALIEEIERLRAHRGAEHRAIVGLPAGASIDEHGAARIAAVARALLSIIDRKGFMTPEHQQIIRDAEEVLR